MRTAGKNLLLTYIGLALFILVLSAGFIFQSLTVKQTSSNLVQTPVDCVSKECTVSPVDLRKTIDNGFKELVPVYDSSQADFPNLDAALDAVKEQKGARLLLLAGREKEARDNHVLSLHTTSSGTEPRVISNTIHLRGETTNDLRFKMPRIQNLERRLIDKAYLDWQRQGIVTGCVLAAQAPEGTTNGGYAWYQQKLREKGFYNGGGSAEVLCQQIARDMIPDSKIGTYFYKMGSLLYSPLIYFTNIGKNESDRSTVEGIVFDNRMMMFQDKDMSYYNNIDNMIPVMQIDNSWVDIINCHFYSAWNSDVNEVIMPVSLDQIRKNRVAAAIYTNSKGEIKFNALTGFWAGGFLGKNGSELLVANNQMRGRWFAVAGRDSQIEMYNNGIFSLDPRLHMGNPLAGGWQALKQQYPDWIGPLPVSDYPHIGVWVKGGSLVMEQNTVGEFNTTVSLENVSSGRVINNVWIFGYSGGINQANSDMVVVTNNMSLDQQGKHANFNIGTCGGSGEYSHIGEMPICMILPYQNSAVAQAQLGFTFGSKASDWNNWRLRYPQAGCSSLIQTYFPQYTCADGLVCGEDQDCDLPASSAQPSVQPDSLPSISPNSGGASRRSKTTIEGSYNYNQ